MRVCFITVGGKARMTGRHLYHREVFARLRASGATVDELVVSAVDLLSQRSASSRLGERVNPRRYDVLLVDALARAAVAPWIDIWRAMRPLVVLFHELPSVASEYDDPQEIAWERALLRADWAITVSRHATNLLVERGARRERIMIASGGFDRLVPPTGLPTPRRTSPGASVLCVAQWIRRKGIVDMVRAWGRVARPGDRLELVGETDADHDYASEVRVAIAAAPTGVIVRGTLRDEDLRQCYAKADFFALPTHYEGYGLVFAEALAYGLPIIAYDTGPIPELIGPDAGLLSPVGDEAALITNLSRLLGDPTLRAAMAAAARARVAELPTWSDTSDRVANALGAAIMARMTAD